MMDMLRCKMYIALVMLLFFAASINVSAQNYENASENETLENETAGKVSFMFVQEAAKGTFVKNADGNYTLTLKNVVPYTMYFSDQPDRIAGFAPMERFIAGYNWRYPNAALSLVDADENMDTVILAISSPRYDNQTGTLIYTAKILEDLVDDRFSYLISRADAGIPERFGRAALFIDDCLNGHIYCCKGGADKECTIVSHCGKVGCGCCWESSTLACEPCRSFSYYEKKCMEEHGKTCNSWYFTTCAM